MKSSILIIGMILFGIMLAFSSDSVAVLSAEQAASYRAGQTPIPSDEPIPIGWTKECVANLHNCNTCVGTIKCDRDRKLPACKWTEPKTECLNAAVDCGTGKVYKFAPCRTFKQNTDHCVANACF